MSTIVLFWLLLAFLLLGMLVLRTVLRRIAHAQGQRVNQIGACSQCQTPMFDIWQHCPSCGLPRHEMPSIPLRLQKTID